MYWHSCEIEKEMDVQLIDGLRLAVNVSTFKQDQCGSSSTASRESFFFKEINTASESANQAEWMNCVVKRIRENFFRETSQEIKRESAEQRVEPMCRKREKERKKYKLGQIVSA